MWLRLVHNIARLFRGDYGLLTIIPLLCLLIFAAGCSDSVNSEVDRLNTLSYDNHYRQLDSTEIYARRAYDLSANYGTGRAEALNNLAFVAIIRMEYDSAQALLSQVPRLTDSQLELLVADVQLMRLCQRRSRNREFYDYREKARQALRRIDEERSALTARQLRRLRYAESELGIVSSTYYYYVGLERMAAQSLLDIGDVAELDTAQYMNYLYNVGSGGIITADTQEEINQQEFLHLMRCFHMAREGGYTYFAANSLEALAELLLTADYRQRLLADNPLSLAEINPEDIADADLALSLADNALSIFRSYGDVYQIAGAYRTVASCWHADGDDVSALYNLEESLADSLIFQAPDLVASIYEQMSVVYAALNNKAASDEYRNLYLDLQEQTRQDRSLEARAGQLDAVVSRLNKLLVAVIGATLMLVALLLFFYLRHRRRGSATEPPSILLEREEQLREQLGLARLDVENSERRFLEQRAKISLVNSITPFIDRMLYTIEHLSSRPQSDSSAQQLQYVQELAAAINEQNDVLTHWIQLRQGELSLHIETFALQELFDIVGKSRTGFAMKGITLTVAPTPALVKADKVLTLFMINTLADNARKFTPADGRVDISATEGSDYVEIAVSDTGIGMTDEQLSTLFTSGLVKDSTVVQGGGVAGVRGYDATRSEESHGFGLLNCKGIIDKYRKLSRIFDVCTIAAESRVGEGSRFFFRLPRGVARLLLWLVALSPLSLQSLSLTAAEPLTRASLYADSAYYSNVDGTFGRTIQLADSCRHYLNRYFLQSNPASVDTLTLMGDPSLPANDILWFHDSLQLNYDILLRMRNECAVAALALHEWALYNYNNRIYTQLYKELSADATLEDYCRSMRRAQSNITMAIIVLVLLFFSILLAVAWQVVAALNRSAKRRRDFLSQLEMMDDELSRLSSEKANLHVSNAVLDNCLSTLKHETMYYPNRISQLVERGTTESLTEVTVYYRELYGILSEQANRQVERAKLHLKPLNLPFLTSTDGSHILGDETLIRYLFDILRRRAVSVCGDVIAAPPPRPAVTCSARDDRYAEVRIPLPHLQLSPDEAAHLFMPSKDHIPYLLCRQIVREHGEATGRRGCGIRAEIINGTTTIIILLPLCKTSKSSS